MSRVCPQCAVESPAEDRFCEDCGTRLEAPRSSPPDCPKCGAGPEEVDPDGYCSACGFRRIASKRDHFEIEISRDFAGVCDRGVRHHCNEDFLAMDTAGEDSRVIVICDGVSSTPDADEASEAAAETAFRSLVQSIESGQDTRRTALLAAIAKAGAAVTALAVEHHNPATTLVAAVVRGNRIDVGWLGDSRAYWIPDAGPAAQLTTDDSESAGSHTITKWLGADAPEDQIPSTMRLETQTPGWLLLCTDGLWNYDPDMTAPDNALDSARKLVAFANESGGHDNITVAICRVGDAASPSNSHEPIQS